MSFLGSMCKEGDLGGGEEPGHLPEFAGAGMKGDLKHSVDFRGVYAGVLGDWLKAPQIKPVLGAEYPKMELIG